MKKVILSRQTIKSYPAMKEFPLYPCYDILTKGTGKLNQGNKKQACPVLLYPNIYKEEDRQGSLSLSKTYPKGKILIMQKNSITSIYFSPAGTTRSIVQKVASLQEGKHQELDLLSLAKDTHPVFHTDDLVIVGMPVYAGRIPSTCPSLLRTFQGNGAKAIAIVAYGNRAYEDALRELETILIQQGFLIIKAAAVIAQHSLFPLVAKNRPDSSDWLKIEHWAKEQRNRPLQHTDEGTYRERGKISFKPEGTEQCNNCGLCAAICPAKAIDIREPRKTDKEKCISCTACIHVCPVHARAFLDEKYPQAQQAFLERNSERKEPEFF